MGSALYLNDTRLAFAAYYCLMAGVIGGWLAILAGMYDLFQYLMKPRSDGLRKGFVHAGLQTTVTFGFTVLLSLEYNQSSFITAPPIWLWVVKILMITIMMIGNYLGGELLFKYVVKQFES